ncbi:MAG: phytochelatin synthase family protein [Prochloraceae cyanobacterium]
MKRKNHPLARLTRTTLQLLTIGLCLSSGGQIKAQTLPVADNLIELNSVEGEILLKQSQAREDYIPLSMHFVTQKNPAYCGVASIVMVMNAMSIPAPATPGFRNYRFFNQDNLFLNPRTETVITAETVARMGMTLEEIAGLLESYPVQTEVYHGSEVTLDEFRDLIVKNLQQDDNFAIVNYLRREIGQERGGHISPIAAYDRRTDRFLILDVSRYKYPPVWVKAEELWQATNTLDRVSGKTRGLVLVSHL